VIACYPNKFGCSRDFVARIQKIAFWASTVKTPHYVKKSKGFFHHTRKISFSDEVRGIGASGDFLLLDILKPSFLHLILNFLSKVLSIVIVILVLAMHKSMQKCVFKTF